MVKVCLCFEVHIPIYFRNYRIFDIGKHSDYFDHTKVREDVKRIVDNSYLPMNRLLLDSIRKHEGDLKVSFYVSGLTLELFERMCPEVIDSFRLLAQTGNVEFLSGSYHNSSRFLVSDREYEEQVAQHRDLIETFFGVSPTTPKIEISEMRNHDISHLIENFSDKSLDHWPLTGRKIADLVSNAKGDVVLYLDYSVFGDKNKEDDGIFHFAESFPRRILEKGESFVLPMDIGNDNSGIDISELENSLLQESAREFSDVRSMLVGMGDDVIIKDLEYMGSQEHVLRMNEDPYEYYVTYMNVMSDLKQRAQNKRISNNELPKSGKASLSELRDALL